MGQKSMLLAAVPPPTPHSSSQSYKTCDFRCSIFLTNDLSGGALFFLLFLRLSFPLFVLAQRIFSLSSLFFFYSFCRAGPALLSPSLLLPMALGAPPQPRGPLGGSGGAPPSHSPLTRGCHPRGPPHAFPARTHLPHAGAMRGRKEDGEGAVDANCMN